MAVQVEVADVPEAIRNRCLHAAVAAVADVLDDEGYKLLDWLARAELLDMALRSVVVGYDRPEAESRMH
jgi:hypothetical protein